MNIDSRISASAIQCARYLMITPTVRLVRRGSTDRVHSPFPHSRSRVFPYPPPPPPVPSFRILAFSHSFCALVLLLRCVLVFVRTYRPSPSARSTLTPLVRPLAHPLAAIALRIALRIRTTFDLDSENSMAATLAIDERKLLFYIHTHICI